MQEAFDRTISLIGEQAFAVLQKSHVLVVGLGGVGGATAEALARSGVGSLTLVDGDNFEPTNLNRQILCTQAELGKNKAEAAGRRISSVIPSTKVNAYPRFIDKSNIEEVLRNGYDYCVDAIDDIPNKLLLIAECKRRGIPIVSALGAGNRTNCDFYVTDIYKTKDDPFARKLRHELRQLGIDNLDVICARTPPKVRLGTPASIAAPPMVMGAMLGGYAVQRLIEQYTTV